MPPIDGSLDSELGERQRRWQRSLALFTGARSSFKAGALPAILLIATLSTVFLFDRDLGHFGRGGHPAWLMSQHLAQAANLSPKHRFLLFVDRTYDVDGDVSHVAYARWPIGSYVLVKLALLLSGDDLATGIYAARVVVLLLFAGTCVFAYLALARLTDRWIALAATLLGFSSHTMLQYSDVFAPDVVPALFGLMLTFHGMVVFVQQGRFAQLLVKSSIALMLCWHVYAVLLPFIVLSIVRELVGATRTRDGFVVALRRCGDVLLASPYVKLGVYAAGLGVLILATSLANEYVAYGAKIPLIELPLLNSAIYRTGFDEGFNEGIDHWLAWEHFVEMQLHHVAALALSSYFISMDIDDLLLDGSRLYGVGMVILAYSLVGLAFVRDRVLFASLLISGILWALALRAHIAAHGFQSIFYVGVVLVALSFVGNWSSRLFTRACVPLAMLLFVLASAEGARTSEGTGRGELEDEVLQDFQAIREVVDQGSVFVPAEQADSNYGGAPFALSYFMSGSILEYGGDYSLGAPKDIVVTRLDLADYLLARRREDVAALVTPHNKHFFLYDRTCVPNASATLRAWGCNADAFAPFTPSSSSTGPGWDVHFGDGRIVLERDECLDVETPIFVHYKPVDRADVGAFDVPNPRTKARGGRCRAVAAIPDFKFEHLRVGQGSWSAESKVYYFHGPSKEHEPSPAALGQL